MTKYLAIFPAKYGDIIRRPYTNKGTAIAVAHRHLLACTAPAAAYCEVYAINDLGRRTLVYEETR